jgi:hypothetical protein
VFQEDRFWWRQIVIVWNAWNASTVWTQCARRIFQLSQLFSQQHLLLLFDWPRKQERHLVPYGFGGTAFGIRNVHEKPNTIVRPCGRALAEYSS